MTATAEHVTIHPDMVTAAVEHVEVLLGVSRPTAEFWAELNRRLELLDDRLLEQYSQDVGPTGVLLSAVIAQPRLRDAVESGIAGYGAAFDRLRLLRRRFVSSGPTVPRAGGMLSEVCVLCGEVRRLRNRIEVLTVGAPGG